ncbi:hypothetical protein VNI00_010658 [Paramarasmius palmivorus]|uniref:Uncharacterized protein n=1 Tax=Paramarasmius palmivorus TaxID=297713 RepID=A0AAW0CGV3_9AGAR
MKFFAAFVALATSVSAYQLKFNSIFDDPNQSLEPLAYSITPVAKMASSPADTTLSATFPLESPKAAHPTSTTTPPTVDLAGNSSTKETRIYVIAVDSAVDGLFNVANSGVDYLTHGEGIAWGTVDLDDAYKVDPACCEMPSDGQCDWQ